MRARIIAAAVALGCAAGGCASVTAPPSAQPSPSPSPTSTQAAPATTTVTQTVPAPAASPPSPAATPTPTPKPAPEPAAAAPAPAPAPAAAQPDPASVVSAFYAAINAQDYATAWNLGGDNFGGSYDSFAADFAGTAHDTLTITGVQGDMVAVHLEALQADGSTKVYDGYYVVDGDQITEGRLTQTSTDSPTAPAAPATSAPAQGDVTDPHGGFYRRGEFCPDADAGLTTVDAGGTVLTCVLESGAYHWH